MNPASPSPPPRHTSRLVPSTTFERNRGEDESISVAVRVARRITRMLPASCVMALCIPACEMVKREAVCANHGSTASALRHDLDAANERDAAPEAAERAAATIRASAKTLDPAAGVPAVDDYKQAMLKLADHYERRSRGDDESEAENIDMAYVMEFRGKAVAFYTWCQG
jgi:hypothetical protein